MLRLYEWLQWIHYAETTAVHAAALVQQLHFLPIEQRSAALFDLEFRRLNKAIGVIEDHLSDRDFLLRTGFSAADVALGYSVHLAQRFLMAGKWRRVESYYDRLRTRPGFIASLPQGWKQPLSWLNTSNTTNKDAPAIAEIKGADEKSLNKLPKDGIGR